MSNNSYIRDGAINVKVFNLITVFYEAVGGGGCAQYLRK